MPIAGAPQAQVNNDIARVAEAFGESWLNEHPGHHKLQKLWQRRDALATIELSALGDSLAVLSAAAPDWVEKKIKLIRKDSGTSHGHLFEIIGGALIRRMNDTYQPTVGNTPGVDGVLTSADGFAIRISLKNHPMSSHETAFRDECKKTRPVILRALKAKVMAHQILIALNEPLLPNEWAKLREFAATIRDIPANEVLSFIVIPDKARITYSRMNPTAESAFATEYQSDTFLAICTHHANEQKNFSDKIYGAVANLRKHAPPGDRALNAIVMRVHQTATIDDLVEYAATILADQEVVDAIVLYQVSATRRGDPTVITYYARPVESPRWVAANQKLQMCLTFGVQSKEASFDQIQMANGDSIRLKNSYMFQAGDHYCVAKNVGDEVVGHTQSPANGIHLHSVFNSGGDGMVISGNFPREEEIVIL
jgi:hypothetical protein